MLLCLFPWGKISRSSIAFQRVTYANSKVFDIYYRIILPEKQDKYLIHSVFSHFHRVFSLFKKKKKSLPINQGEKLQHIVMLTCTACCLRRLSVFILITRIQFLLQKRQSLRSKMAADTWLGNPLAVGSIHIRFKLLHNPCPMVLWQ